MNYQEAEQRILAELGSDFAYTDLLRSADKLEHAAVCKLETVIRDLLPEDARKYARRIYRDNYGLGAITEPYYDAGITEIWVNAPDDIWIERDGLRSKYMDGEFHSDSDVRRVIDLLCRFDKKEISVTSPIVECKLADGSRLTALIPPVTGNPSFALRCPNAFTPSTANMLKSRTVDQNVIDLLRLLVRGRANILVIGEAGAGKTQFIRWLVGFMRPDTRVTSIETRQELYLRKLYTEGNFRELEECPEIGKDMRELFRTTLRLSPDVIICGEMRSYEAEWVMNAMRRGHPGSMSSMHTISPEFVISDIAEMICDDGKARDPLQLTERIASAIDIVVQVNRSHNTGKRRVKRISEISAGSTDARRPYEIIDLIEHDDSTDSFLSAGRIYSKALQQKLLHYAGSGPDAIPREKIESFCCGF